MCKPCDFIAMLEANSHTDFAWINYDSEGNPVPGVPFESLLIVQNTDPRLVSEELPDPPETVFDMNAIREGEARALIVQTHQGRLVEQMTRVTGYFSKISGWNKGKQGELKERARPNIEETNTPLAS